MQSCEIVHSKETYVNANGVINCCRVIVQRTFTLWVHTSTVSISVFSYVLLCVQVSALEQELKTVEDQLKLLQEMQTAE